jgi:hypothetical protein
MSALVVPFTFRAQLSIDGTDVLDPPPPVGVLQLQDLAQGPVEVVGQEGYLLVEPVEGVARDSPELLASTSNWCVQAGHVAEMRGCPFSLRRW